MERGVRDIRGDQKRSAIAAMRGQMRESTVSGLTYSAPHAGLPAQNARPANRRGIARQRIDGVVETARAAGDRDSSRTRESRDSPASPPSASDSGAAPGLNHRIAAPGPGQDLIPADHVLPYFCSDLLHALVEIRLQCRWCAECHARARRPESTARLFHCLSSTSSPPMWK